MNRQQIRRRLARIEPRLSLIRQVELVLDDIERALIDGAGLDEVRSALDAGGLPISKNTLKRCLYRLRQERRAQSHEVSA
jgi:hypothetical protein